MWFSAIKLALNAGTHIYKKRQETKMLMADAQATHASRMARGELEYKQAFMTNNQHGWKDEFVLLLVSAPVMILIWSIFSDVRDFHDFLWKSGRNWHRNKCFHKNPLGFGSEPI